MEIIGLSGYARSGKDEAAKVLVGEFGFKRVAFADKLREVLYQLDPMVSASTWENSLSVSPYYLKDVIDKYGWDGYKETPYGQQIRRLLQRMGTEAGRQALWDNIWIDAALNPYKNGNQNIVVTDCRFPNEARAIQDMGGVMWRINRINVGPANDHPSETSLDNWRFDFTLENDTNDLETYHAAIKNLYYLHRQGSLK